MASGRCMNKLVELLVEAVVKEAARVTMSGRTAKS
jgi:hypothetical protein